MLEESEEEENSVNLSVSRGGPDGEKNLRVKNKLKGEDGGEMGSSTRRRVLIDGEPMGDESFYIEEIYH